MIAIALPVEVQRIFFAMISLRIQTVVLPRFVTPGSSRVVAGERSAVGDV